jgi:2-phosphoglycerate kinase
MPRVVFIGGAPFSGKSCVARQLAGMHGLSHICTDDIGLAARAVTGPDSCPQLHAMRSVGSPFADYYADHTPDGLLADAFASHRALWPAVWSVAKAHAEWAPAAIVEGWALLPEFVLPVLGPGVAAVWICASPSTLRRRIEEDGFLAGNEQASQSYLDRSVAFDQWLRAATPRHLLVEVPPHATIEDWAERCWDVAGSRGEAERR